MDKVVAMIERGAKDMQGIATVMSRPSSGSVLAANVNNATSVAAAMLLNSIGIAIPLAE